MHSRLSKRICISIISSLCTSIDKEILCRASSSLRCYTLIERVWIKTVCTLVKSGLCKHFRHESAFSCRRIRVYSSANFYIWHTRASDTSLLVVRNHRATQSQMRFYTNKKKIEILIKILQSSTQNRETWQIDWDIHFFSIKKLDKTSNF